MGTKTENPRPDAKQVFDESGLRCTRQRLALYEALRNDHNHPTAEDLYRAVCAKTRPLSRATVYNTLETLCQHGLARQLPTTDGTCRYDADTSSHVHIRHVSDSRIEDVPTELARRLVSSISPQLIGEVELRLGVQIDSINIQLATKPGGQSSSSQRPAQVSD
jgi:Fe2+ or Zn2+ uptake regulation protein